MSNKDNKKLFEKYQLKNLDEANARHLLQQDDSVKDIISQDDLKFMEINGADLANKHYQNDDFLRKFYRIKDQDKRKIMLDYIKKNTPRASLEVYTLKPLKDLNHDEAKKLILSDEDVKKIIDLKALDEQDIDGQELDELTDNHLKTFWKIRNENHRKILLAYFSQHKPDAFIRRADAPPLYDGNMSSVMSSVFEENPELFAHLVPRAMTVIQEDDDELRKTTVKQINSSRRDRNDLRDTLLQVVQDAQQFYGVQSQVNTGMSDTQKEQYNRSLEESTVMMNQNVERLCNQLGLRETFNNVEMGYIRSYVLEVTTTMGHNLGSDENGVVIPSSVKNPNQQEEQKIPDKSTRQTKPKVLEPASQNPEPIVPGITTVDDKGPQALKQEIPKDFRDKNADILAQIKGAITFNENNLVGQPSTDSEFTDDEDGNRRSSTF